MAEVVKRSGVARAAQVIAIIAFALVMSALATALITDIVLFAQQIFGFIAACLVSAIVFILGFILMIISCILIFGIYLLGDRGFWPLDWAAGTFQQIIDENRITPEQVAVFGGIRIFLIISCVLVLVLSIICLALNKSVKKEERAKVTTPFGVVGIVFSILGLLSAICMLLIISALA